MRFNDASGWCNKSIKSFFCVHSDSLKNLYSAFLIELNYFCNAIKKINLKLFDANTVPIEALFSSDFVFNLAKNIQFIAKSKQYGQNAIASTVERKKREKSR